MLDIDSMHHRPISNAVIECVPPSATILVACTRHSRRTDTPVASPIDPSGV